MLHKYFSDMGKWEKQESDFSSIQIIDGKRLLRVPRYTKRQNDKASALRVT